MQNNGPIAKSTYLLPSIATMKIPAEKKLTVLLYVSGQVSNTQNSQLSASMHCFGFFAREQCMLPRSHHVEVAAISDPPYATTQPPSCKKSKLRLDFAYATDGLT